MYYTDSHFQSVWQTALMAVQVAKWPLLKQRVEINISSYTHKPSTDHNISNIQANLALITTEHVGRELVSGMTA